MENENKVIWKDRIRHFGLSHFLFIPLSFTRYRIENKKLFVNKGLFNITEEQILLYRMIDFSLSQTLWQRIFNMGDVKIISADQIMPEIILKNINNPSKIRDLISDMVENIKKENNMMGKEMFGVAGENIEETLTDDILEENNQE